MLVKEESRLQEISRDFTARITERIGESAPVLKDLPLSEGLPLEGPMGPSLGLWEGLPKGLPEGEDFPPAVWQEILRLLGISFEEQEAYPDYFSLIRSGFRVFTPEGLREEDAYFGQIRAPKNGASMGSFTLTEGVYERGELFLYDEPLRTEEGLYVPQIGISGGKICFPAVYEDRIPWMSACPSEIYSMKEPVRKCLLFCEERKKRLGRGCRVLALGLGIGYLPLLASENPAIEEIFVAEISPEIITLFSEYLLPQFSRKDKIHILRQDAFELLRKLKAPGERLASFSEEPSADFVFADTWESQFDGAKDYLRIKKQEQRLNGDEGLSTGFSYWIEREILDYLREFDM